MFWTFVERAQVVLSHLRPIDWVLWLGLVALTLALAVLAWTRWGQSKPLQKCFVLSVLAHLLIATYATSVKFVSSAPRPKQQVFQLAVMESGDPEAENPRGDLLSKESTAEQPWNAFDSGAMVDTPIDAPAPSEVVVESEPTPAPEADVESAPVAPLPSAEPAESAEEVVEAPPAQATEAAPAAPLESQSAPASQAAPIEVGAAPKSAPSAEPPLPNADVSPVQPDVAPATLETSPPAPTGLPNDLASDLATELKVPELPDTLRGGLAENGSDYGAPDAAAALEGVVEGPLAPVGLPSAPAAALALPSGGGGSGVAPETVLAPTHPSGVPSPYRLRMAPDRAAAAARQGASAQSEAAVEAALAWLAKTQEPDGHWDPRKYGGGVERQPLGQARPGAGAHADNGVTGLALLAFLGAGHTHLEGEHAATVRRGIDYLIRNQAPDGNLGGVRNAQDPRQREPAKYAMMYCHGMAGLALSEAYALSNDKELIAPISRALAFTLSMQHSATGGWRYNPGDLGDTSQLGWQLMFLKSAEWGGFRVPQSARDGAARFLTSVSSGRSGGLASYRPRERTSVPMTAEALACRLLLGAAPGDAACREASELLLTSLPGEGPDNFYYWYYATFALHHMQGESWQRWNQRLQNRLITTQRTSGPDAGSWDAICLWGGYGGQVYTTAMATLSLEVYYRYLPLLQERTAEGTRVNPR